MGIIIIPINWWGNWGSGRLNKQNPLIVFELNRWPFGCLEPFSYVWTLLVCPAFLWAWPHALKWRKRWFKGTHPTSGERHVNQYFYGNYTREVLSNQWVSDNLHVLQRRVYVAFWVEVWYKLGSQTSEFWVLKFYGLNTFYWLVFVPQLTVLRDHSWRGSGGLCAVLGIERGSVHVRPSSCQLYSLWPKFYFLVK